MGDRITSTANKGVKHVRELLNKAKLRRETGTYVVEGERICLELGAEMIETLYIADGYRGRIPKLTDEGRLVRVTDSVMDYMADTKTSQGILAVAKQLSYQQLSGDFFLMLENIQDPGNLGTIFRTAEAAGVSGIVMNRGCVDLYAPKVVRSTMGAIYRVPFLIVDDLITQAEQWKTEGVQVYAAHLKGQSYHFDCDFKAPCAFMIGNEGNGLSDALTAHADAYVRIPMKGSVESLNAAVAATVLMYEAVRQRSPGES